MGRGRSDLGRRGEERAVRYLESRGCQVVARNWRCPAGEADVVVLEGTCLAFVEVRTRRGAAYGTPEESITPRKLEHMAAVAQTYVQEQSWEGDWRLDLVAIRMGGEQAGSIEWYRNVSM